LTANRLTNSWFCQQEVHAVPLVLEEMTRFRDIVHDKLLFLVQMAGNGRRRKHRDDNERGLRTLLEEVSFQLYRIARTAERNRYKCADTRWDKSLHTLACTVSYLNGIAHLESNRRSEYLFADEQLVSTALYRSIIEGKSTAIVTRDSGINLLLRHCVDHCAKSSYPLCDALTMNPIRIFFVGDAQDVALQLDSSLYRPRPYEDIRNRHFIWRIAENTFSALPNDQPFQDPEPTRSPGRYIPSFS